MFNSKTFRSLIVKHLKNRWGERCKRSDRVKKVPLL